MKNLIAGLVLLTASCSGYAQEILKFNAKCVTTNQAKALVTMLDMKIKTKGQATGLWENHSLEIFRDNSGYTLVFVTKDGVSCLLVEGREYL